jgi:hypothetical protein
MKKVIAARHSRTLVQRTWSKPNKFNTSTNHVVSLRDGPFGARPPLLVVATASACTLLPLVGIYYC